MSGIRGVSALLCRIVQFAYPYFTHRLQNDGRALLLSAGTVPSSVVKKMARPPRKHPAIDREVLRAPGRIDRHFRIIEARSVARLGLD
jgi:hypothetical protein